MTWNLAVGTSGLAGGPARQAGHSRVTHPRGGCRGAYRGGCRRGAVEPGSNGAGYEEPGGRVDEAHARLVAVDLGVRTGIAVFDGGGRLVSVTSRNLGQRGRVRQLATALRRELDRVDVLVLEGDRSLAPGWRRAFEPRGTEVVLVEAEEWRRALLHPRERRDARTAKAAARDLAAVAVAELSTLAGSSLRHDAAEAVLIGVWGLRELGWVAAWPPGLDPRRR